MHVNLSFNISSLALLVAVGVLGYRLYLKEQELKVLRKKGVI